MHADPSLPHGGRPVGSRGRCGRAGRGNRRTASRSDRECRPGPSPAAARPGTVPLDPAGPAAAIPPSRSDRELPSRPHAFRIENALTSARPDRANDDGPGRMGHLVIRSAPATSRRTHTRPCGLPPDRNPARKLSGRFAIRQFSSIIKNGGMPPEKSLAMRFRNQKDDGARVGPSVLNLSFLSPRWDVCPRPWFPDLACCHPLACR